MVRIIKRKHALQALKVVLFYAKEIFLILSKIENDELNLLIPQLFLLTASHWIIAKVIKEYNIIIQFYNEIL